MSYEDIIAKLRKEIMALVPKRVEISNIEVEGPVVVIRTKDIEDFSMDSNLVKKLAQGLKRRVSIRPDPSLVKGVDEAKAIINEIIPPEAEVTDVHFNMDFNEVLIEARSPGLAIGKHGMNLNEIKLRTGWTPTIVRSPPIPSKTLKDIRRLLMDPEVAEKRRKFLKSVGRKIFQEIPKNEEQWVRLTSLGGYREVGRSCHLLSTRYTRIMIDCGINVSSNASPSPYLNAPEVTPLSSSIDAVVVTHAHLDHSGLVPLLFKYGYDGPVYCTHPTRDLMALLQIDYLKVAAGESGRPPYDSSHIRDMLIHTIPIKYNETTDIAPDVKLTLHNAGHILGSAVAHFHIGGGLYNIVFTGDIKFERTWLFNAARNKFPRVEGLVMESTYGGRKDFQPTRKEASAQLKNVVKRTIQRGGKVIIPVFAVGRSQEVMIVLERMMKNNTLPTTPIYLDGMIWEATAIHTAYPEYLNNQLRTQIFQRNENPFLSEVFHRVDSRDMRENILASPDPMIVLATSGMLNGGPVMEYLKAWGPEPENTLIFVGYQAEGTLGRKIQKGLTELLVPSGDIGKPRAISLKLEVVTIDGFSGHADRRQLVNYVATMEPKPERIILSHGDEQKSEDLAISLQRRYNIKTQVPMNLETMRLI
ncbi:MAG: beta-CASP ribonuclease aCPSF1 [Thermoplasmata archaeon]|nr:MAG: beta-CASP ribonuclease aCPSF1 [Thermoplasmata archaeon]RLF71471.1 MAG: beta-CASP ribonuclease aCPSF1 [Thermoplasmata archaeon]RLF72295.1 MAG: beta-CASP ribonuclease aCPSF1 [Thermoplasmata archaeon]RLF74283.1 MAG: beta-CASP ribonuclease aCPSF1 [Thermoplasmata archaeon]RLF76900.1 MAG: beta-CASP ribonuclease aCPSF1 [Thermoplasmata archaeon]